MIGMFAQADEIVCRRHRRASIYHSFISVLTSMQPTHQLSDRLAGGRLTINPLIPTLCALLFFILSSGSLIAQAPVFVFADGIGGSGHDFGRSIAADGNGNSYVAGIFGGTVDFDPGAGTANLTSIDVSDIFVAKYDSAGNYLWAFQIGGTSGSEPLIAVDGGGNVVVTSGFTGTVDFDPGVGAVNLTSPPWGASFVARYTPTGNYVWAFPLQGAGGVSVAAIAIDGSNNIVITGNFSYSVDFDPGPGNGSLNASNAGDASIFFAKYSAAGAYIWAFVINGGSGVKNAGNQAHIHSLAIDGNNNIYVTGSFNCIINFNPSGKGSLKPSGTEMFIAKYTSSGKYGWAYKIASNSGGYVAVDAGGNVYLTGAFQGTVDFNPGTGTANLTSAGNYDIVVAKYNTSGTYLWAFSVGGASADAASIIAISGNDVYVTGTFNGVVDFDPGASSATLTSVNTETFVARYDTSGAYIWAFDIDGNCRPRSLAVDDNGTVYATGNFTGTADFDPGIGTAYLTSTVNTSGFSADIFIALYNEPVLPKRSVDANIGGRKTGVELRVAPNPFAGEFTFHCNGASAPSRVEILDLMGRVLESHDVADPNQELTLGFALPAGTYFLQLHQGGATSAVMIHKVK